VVEPDDRHARLHREIHDLADLAGVRVRKRAAEHREVLGEYESRPAVDATRARDDAVAESPLPGHVEVVALVDDELVDLHERPGVQQEREPLARGLLAGLVLAADALVTAGGVGLHVTSLRLLEAGIPRTTPGTLLGLRWLLH